VHVQETSLGTQCLPCYPPLAKGGWGDFVQDIKERKTRYPGQPCRLSEGEASGLEIVERSTHPHFLYHVLGLLPQSLQKIIRDINRDA
jgi:hypothetical protein